MKLNRTDSKSSEKIKHKLEYLSEDQQKFLAKFVYIINKFKLNRINKTIAICSLFFLFITLKSFANSDILNNWFKINDKNIISSVYSKSNYLYDNSKLTYSNFKDIEKDFNLEFFKPDSLFPEFSLDVIEVNSDKDKNRIRINALYINPNKHNIVYNIYIGKSNSTNSKVVKEKKDTKVKEIDFNGIKFLAFQNNHWWSVSWYSKNIEYEIHGFKNEQEILNTIKNINI